MCCKKNYWFETKKTHLKPLLNLNHLPVIHHSPTGESYQFNKILMTFFVTLFMTFFVPLFISFLFCTQTPNLIIIYNSKIYIFICFHWKKICRQNIFVYFEYFSFYFYWKYIWNVKGNVLSTPPCLNHIFVIIHVNYII